MILSTQPKIELTNEDCMDLMARYPDKHFDLAIVDPPYFKGVAKKNFYGSKVSTTGIKRKQSSSEVWDGNIPTKAYYDELVRVSKHQIIWGINYFDFGKVPVGRVIWDKENDTSTFSNAEIASCSMIESVKMFRHLWNGMLQKNMANKWRPDHPSPKPPELYKALLLAFAKKGGGKILDTHAGSFSIGLACYDLGLDLTACELDPKFCADGQNALLNYIKQGSLFKPEDTYMQLKIT